MRFFFVSIFLLIINFDIKYHNIEKKVDTKVDTDF